MKAPSTTLPRWFTAAFQRVPGQGRNWCSAASRKLFFERAGHRCVCGARASDGAVLHLDHLDPFGFGWTNIVVLCEACNCSKGQRNKRQWLAQLRRNGVTECEIRRISRRIESQRKRHLTPIKGA